MATIEARRRAVAAYKARRTAAGHKQIAVLLAPDVVAKLDDLARHYGGQSAALIVAIEDAHADMRAHDPRP